jgi:CRISPR-associated protein (TIGR03984 family)
MSLNSLWIMSLDGLLPWQEAVAAAIVAVPELATAIVMGVGKGGCVFAKVEGTQLVAHPDAPLPSIVFEVRVFGPDAEMRWVAKGQQTANEPYSGTAVLLREAAAAPELQGWSTASEALQPLWRGARKPPKEASRYLLWGVARASTGNWSQLWEHRIGALWVPLAVPLGARIAAEYVEYIGPADSHGNVSIAAERWNGLVQVEAK